MKTITYISRLCLGTLLLPAIIDMGCKTKCNGHRTKTVYNEGHHKTKEYTVNCNDVNDGPYTEFYEDGSIKAKLNYANGAYAGKQESFYYNGNLQSRGFCINNRLDSIQVYYYPNGTLKQEIFRLNGQLFGVQKEYDEAGALSDMYFMMNDSSMTGSYTLDRSGAVIEKKGISLNCIYNKDKMHVNDSITAIFYLLIPPNFQFRCEIVGSNDKKELTPENNPPTIINNNLGVLITKSYAKAGKYKFGMKLILSHDRFKTVKTESVLIPVTVE